jgi:hypothetical protein
VEKLVQTEERITRANKDIDFCNGFMEEKKEKGYISSIDDVKRVKNFEKDLEVNMKSSSHIIN